MDGFYNNGGSYNSNSSGYSQRPSNNNSGSCYNCPGGNCPRMSGGNQSQGMSSSQQGCPGGNCCPGGRCTIGRSRSNQDWQNYGR